MVGVVVWEENVFITALLRSGSHIQSANWSNWYANKYLIPRCENMSLQFRRDLHPTLLSFRLCEKLKTTECINEEDIINKNFVPPREIERREIIN